MNLVFYLTFSDFVGPICLPFDQKPILDEEQVTVAGWGVYQFLGKNKHFTSIVEIQWKPLNVITDNFILWLA
jgi:hypothetical protein